MKKEINVNLKPDYVQQYKDGYPLLLKEAIADFDKLTQEGVILNLFTSSKKFIAKAYHGLQNKGFGWVLTSDKNTVIDSTFFASKIKSAVESRKDFYADAI